MTTSSDSCPVFVGAETLEASNESKSPLNGWAIEDAFNSIPFDSDDFTHEEKKQPDGFDSEDPNDSTDEGKEEPEGFQQEGLESNEVLRMDDSASLNTDSGRKAFCIGEEPLGLLEPLSPSPECDAPFMSIFSGFEDEAGTYLYIRPCRGGATNEPRMRFWRRGPEGNVIPIA